MEKLDLCLVHRTGIVKKARILGEIYQFNQRYLIVVYRDEHGDDQLVDINLKTNRSTTSSWSLQWR